MVRKRSGAVRGRAREAELPLRGNGRGRRLAGKRKTAVDDTRPSRRVAAAPREAKRPRHEYRSGFERRLRAQLDAKGIPYDYEGRTFDIRVPAAAGHVCRRCAGTKIDRRVRYTPDFIFRAWIVEAKGKFTARHRRLALAMKEQYPEVRYALLFQRDNWMTSAKKQRYSDWARLNGIPYAIGEEIPEEWTK